MKLNKLKAKIIEKGMNVEGLADAIGMERSTLYRKLNKFEKITIRTHDFRHSFCTMICEAGVDIKTAMEEGVNTVLICAASHEQHGPHLAESTDYIIGKAMCEGVAQRLGNALVAPLIRPGLSVHHMNHPGSLTLRPEVFRGLVEDYVDCYVRHGFTNLVLLSSHGGNYAVLHEVAEEMQKKYPERNIVCPLALSELFDVSINTLLGSPQRLICQCCGMPLEDGNISKEPDGFFNEEYCKWCYADGEYMYHDMDDLIALGIVGLEVCHPDLTEDEKERALAIALERDLYVSGGSDHSGLLGGLYPSYPTEEALKAVPDSYREGSFGLGAGRLRTVFKVVLPYRTCDDWETVDSSCRSTTECKEC